MVGGIATEFQISCSLTPASKPQTSLASIYFLLPSSGETLPYKSLETLKERYFLPCCTPKLIWFLKGQKLLFCSYLRYSIYLPQSGFPLSFHYRIKQGKPLLVSLKLWKVCVAVPISFGLMAMNCFGIWWVYSLYSRHYWACSGNISKI